jgi:hypothetical protein
VDFVRDALEQALHGRRPFAGSGLVRIPTADRNP